MDSKYYQILDFLNQDFLIADLLASKSNFQDPTGTIPGLIFKIFRFVSIGSNKNGWMDGFWGVETELLPT
jgi:hypothetical protein